MFQHEIDYNLAYRAYVNSSFDPDKRAKAEPIEYQSHLDQVADELDKIGYLDQFEKFHLGFKKRYISLLEAKTRTASSMITGPANFPLARNRKAQDVEHKRLEDLLGYKEWFVDKCHSKANGESIIKSGDKDAVERLKADIASCERNHDLMKQGNKLIKKGCSLQDLIDLGLPEEGASWAISTKYGGPWGFGLANNSANTRRLKKRLASIEAKKEMGAKEVDYGVCKARQCSDTMRVQLIFDGKPSKEIISILKSKAFRWSPKATAWQRQWTNAGVYALEQAVRQIKELEA